MAASYTYWTSLPWPTIARVSHVSLLGLYLYKWTPGSNITQWIVIDIVDSQARDVDRQVQVTTRGSRSGSMMNHADHWDEELIGAPFFMMI